MTDLIRYRWRYGGTSGFDITDVNHYAATDAVSATAWSGEDYVIALKRDNPDAPWEVDSVGHPVPLPFYDIKSNDPDTFIQELAAMGGARYEEGDEL